MKLIKISLKKVGFYYFSFNISNEGRVEPASRATLYYALAEAICSIDEDNKHTDQIVLLLKQIRESNWKYSFASSWLHDNSDMDAMDTIKIDDLEDGLQETSVFHLADDFDVESAEHIPQLLASDVLISNVGKQCLKVFLDCHDYKDSNIVFTSCRFCTHI